MEQMAIIAFAAVVTIANLVVDIINFDRNLLRNSIIDQIRRFTGNLGYYILNCIVDFGHSPD